MKYPFLLAFLASIFTTAKSQELLVCGNSKVLIVNVKNRVDTLVERIWMWDAHEANDIPLNYRKKFFRNIDECKAYENGTKILISSSGGGVALINRADKNVLFYAYVPNAHSAEILPRNRVVVAGSINKLGNCLQLYDLDQSEKLLYRDTIFQAHGVIWNNKTKKLYAIGYNELNEYKLKDWHTSTPILEKIKSNILPSLGGHELQRYRHSNTLICSTSRTVYLFDQKKSNFIPYNPLKKKRNVKSLSYNISNSLISFTVAEQSYWSRHVYFVGSKHFLSFPDIEVYKAHWVN